MHKQEIFRNEISRREEVISEQPIVVLKFGGSAMANADRISHVAKIVRDRSRDFRVVVVVSAMEGVTNRLYNILHNIDHGRFSEAAEEVDFLEHVHREAGASVADYCHDSLLSVLMSRLKTDLLAYAQSASPHPSDRDCIVSYGERFSPFLLAGAINNLGLNSEAVDAAKVIVTTNDYSDAKANLELSEQKAKPHLAALMKADIIPIVGGFYGASEEGKIAILGRGGSDYSGAILARSVGAYRYELFKDVLGIFTSDPKKDPSATCIPRLSYEEAEVKAKDGAKVLHPEAMNPLKEKNIMVVVRSYLEPEHPGTQICQQISQ